VRCYALAPSVARRDPAGNTPWRSALGRLRGERPHRISPKQLKHCRLLRMIPIQSRLVYARATGKFKGRARGSLVVEGHAQGQRVGTLGDFDCSGHSRATPRDQASHHGDSRFRGDPYRDMGGARPEVRSFRPRIGCARWPTFWSRSPQPCSLFSVFGLFRAVIRFVGSKAMVTVIAGVSV
jgi:hypothetical protein